MTMDLNKPLKNVLILFLLFMFSSCDRNKTGRGHTRVQGPEQYPQVHSFHNCKAELKSYKSNPCFYQLPNIKNSEYFTSRYADSSDINKAGVTLGKGQWLCQKGVWQQVYSPLCLTCLPGRSFEDCKSKWETLYKKLY